MRSNRSTWQVSLTREGQKSRSLANRIGVGRSSVWSDSKHAPSPEVNCTYLLLRYDPRYSAIRVDC